MACSKCKNIKVVDSVEPHHTVKTNTVDAHVNSTHVPTKQYEKFSISVTENKPVSFSDIKLKPTEAPSIHVIRDEDFKNQLVEIEAANVVKGFCKPHDVIHVEESCKKVCEPESCINPHAHVAHKATGKDLDHSYKNALDSEEAVLLARKGNKLVRLIGEGVVYISKGIARVTNEIPLKVSKLYHKWFQPTANSSPIIGQPMAFPYQVIADHDGNPFVIQGLANEDSFTVWDYENQVFYQKPVSDFPNTTRSQLPSANRLELVGFEPLGVLDDPETLRALKKISGKGILRFTEVETAPTPVCDCDECTPTNQEITTTTVAEFIPDPVNVCDADCPYILAFDPDTLTPSWVQATDIECIRGEAGMDATTTTMD